MIRGKKEILLKGQSTCKENKKMGFTSKFL